jgi:hypothetical protein
VPSPQDAADALAVAICHMHSTVPGRAAAAVAAPAARALTNWRHYRPARS